MNILFFDVHGITIELRTKNGEYSEFVEENYSLFQTDSDINPDIIINFTREGMEYARKKLPNHSHIGNNVYISKQSIFWKNEFGFQILVENQQSATNVYAYHQELLDGQRENERYKNYQRCMRWTMHYPLFTLYQYNRGWNILHGAAVTNGHQTIAFCGLNKMGKSTLATYLCCEHDYDILTDNYLLYDREHMYAFPEVLRLGERSKNQFDVEPIWEHKIYNKYHISPGELGTQIQAAPDVFFILSRGEQLQTTALEPKKAWETMENLHSMLAEFPQHGYMSVWPLISGRTREKIDRRDPLYQTQWHSLTYEPDWNIERVVQEVNQCI